MHHTEIEKNSSTQRNLPAPAQTFKPRKFTPLNDWKNEAWTIKVYGIHHDTSRASESLIDEDVENAAQEFVFKKLGKANKEGNHYHCGFTTIHQGSTQTWLVFNWWAHDNICCEILAFSPTQNFERFELYEGPAMACIWELVIIDFERKCWSDTALSGARSIETYLQKKLPAGTY